MGMVCNLKSFCFYYSKRFYGMYFDQVYFGGQRVGILHEETAEEEREGCWCCLNLSWSCESFPPKTLPSDFPFSFLLLELSSVGLTYSIVALVKFSRRIMFIFLEMV